MHPNPAFRQTETDRALQFARGRGFGVLAINGASGPLISHVPFLLNPAGDALDLHLVRSNPIVRVLEAPSEAVIAVNGPDGYVSPDWYEVPDQVPTWNYVAVHLRGTLHRLPQEEMHDMLDRQSSDFEGRLPKKPWTTAKMSPDALDRMMRQIVPCRMRIDDVRSTFKLNQNKPDPVRLSAADGMEASGIGYETVLLSRMMRDPEGEI
ncbi:FMN-binding negative transcriptional regulator [Jannaschia aquimarina]|uniref:PaiB protein n=1 Tax=Jannaschia aquimarina TaxID=935700 RepID=A0A0D1EGN5_9RHOB|nr:FMN-binding negative transcriptional regulator [Jannaschia aquimarina]KIT15010.1 Protease synthase and sporulation protein PAI 2 [Jannaschia aquimarina]SNS61881.1 negative transcriptional regulator, PaiB family [Jannaschia aquimarina]